MPYSADNPPRWASKKSKAVQKVAIEVFNTTLKDTADETKAQRASMKAMTNAEKAFKKKTNKALINKSLDNEKRLATFVVLEPQNIENVSDGHGDFYDEETILDACIQFNKSLNERKGTLYHMVDTEGYSFVESYVTLADMDIDGQIIRKGTWLQTIYVSSDWIWNGIKDGTFNGLSVECIGTVEDI